MYNIREKWEVAVLDTGIYKHIDFGNRIIAFKDFINNRVFPYDDSGHGTHVSGIIAGDGYASHGRFKGIAPMSQIISVKVLDSNGNGNIENVIKGTKWIINNKDIYNKNSKYFLWHYPQPLQYFWTNKKCGKYVEWRHYWLSI